MKLTLEQEFELFKSEYKIGDMVKVKIDYKNKYVRIKEIKSLFNVVVEDNHNREYIVRGFDIWK